MIDGDVERRLTQWRLIFFSVMLLLCFNAFFAINLWIGWQDRVASAQDDTRSLAESIDAHTSRTISTVDLLLSGIVEVLLERMGHHNQGKLSIDDPEVTTLLRHRGALVPYIRAITILDQHGLSLNDSRVENWRQVDRSDRPYFTFHRDRTSDELFIDTPRMSRVDNLWFIGMSRRVHDLDGNFAGVVVAILDPGAFDQFYTSLGTAATITLLDQSGTIFVRYPDFKKWAGQPSPERTQLLERLKENSKGSFTEITADGQKLIVGYHKVANTPLITTAALSFDQALAPWYRQLLTQALAALLANAAVIVFTAVLLGHIRRLKAASRALQLNERTAVMARQQLLDAIESITEGFILFDSDERIILFNQRYRKMMGPVAGRLVPGLSYEALLRAEIEAQLFTNIGANPKRWLAERLEHHRNPGGAPIEQQLTTGEWVLAWVYPTREGGRVHIRTDISYLKEKQMQVVHQEMILRTTFENSVQGMCVFDRDHRLLLWNRHWLRLLQLPESFGQVGTPLTDVLLWRARRGDYGDGDPDAIVARRMRLLSALDDHVDERELPHGVAVEVSGVQMPGGSRLTTYYDITVRRKAELALRHETEILETTLESVDQGIALFDADFRLTAANRRYYLLLQFDPNEFPLGTPYETFLRRNAERGDFGFDQLEQTIHHRWQAVVQQQPSIFELTPPNGTVIEARRVPTPRGGFVTTYTDVSERKLREDELQAAKLAAERTSEVKSLFLAKMSHELRTPFNAIIGFAEIIADRSFGTDAEALDSYANYAVEIRESAQHLLDLVNNILDVSKIESGRMSIRVERFDLRKCLISSLAMLQELARSQSVTLSLEVDTALPESCADERAVKQIVTNLLSNALKFTPAGGTISVSARPGLEDGFEIIVSDTGVGIPADQIGRVLLPFEQVDNRYSRAAGGTGLGLSLVKGLVELHGGTIQIDSTVGSGTTVTVAFPANPPDFSSQRQPKAQANAA